MLPGIIEETENKMKKAIETSKEELKPTEQGGLPLLW